MALQSSGQLKFSQIENEFGKNGSRSLGKYRVSQSFGALKNLPLDSGIPQSGQIKFSDFYGKRLNIIVNYYSGGTVYRQNARSKYNSNSSGQVPCVGGFRSRPSNSSGTKVRIHVNKKIGSKKSSNRTLVALKTGTWNGGTQLIVDVGGSGKIIGAGGNGGKGGDNNKDKGEDGENGTSGLGLSYPVTINNSGLIAGGGGGGAGGGGAYDTDKWDDELASGGGGGGGAGLPSGNGGERGNGWEADGEKGEDGGQNGGGSGGEGGKQDGEAIGGDGGNGGDLGDDGENGEKGKGEKDSNGGEGGENGYWIVTDGNNYSITTYGGTTEGSATSADPD
tara:strand:- start:7165 stop:8169 length:1005 start_codon:yes stop_codon:yes gene_type:complete